MPKDASKPKQPKTAYFLFQDDMRPKVIASQPALAKDIAQLGKAIGAEWAKLSDGEKKGYTEKADSLKRAFEAEHGPIVRGGAKKEKAGKAPKGEKASGPKRAMSAYMFFSNELSAELRKSHPGQAITEIAKQVGAKWKETTDRSKFDALAAKDKARYEAEKAKA